MERYIGMDVHAASCTLAVISEKGRKLKDFPVETNGQALVEAVRMIPGHKHLVFEEGLQSAWLYETLRPHVDELVVTGITTSRGPKSDKRDAYGLAEKLRVGNLDKPVFKAPRRVHPSARALADSHDAGGGRGARASSNQELVPGARSSGDGRGCLRHTPPQGMAVAASLGGPNPSDSGSTITSTSCRSRRSRPNPIYFARPRSTAIVRILETAPGFGPIRSARLVPIVVTPHRFRTRGDSSGATAASAS